jgi:hypothetical protein
MALYYKICQVGWTLDPAELNLDAASMEGDCASASGSGAYLFDDGKCKYAFDAASEFTGIAGATADNGDVDYNGFTLKMTSSNACDGANFVVTLNANCGTDEVPFKVTASDKCSMTAEYTGPKACKAYNFKVGKHLKKVEPFFGSFLILFGLVMCFAGAKFLFQLFGGMIFLATATVVFGGVYNAFLPPDTNMYIVGGLAAVAIGLGVGAAIFTYKFAKEWSVSLLAAWGGVVLALVIVKLAKIDNATATIALCVVGAVGAGYLGKQMNKLVSTAGTAFVGAGFVIKGIMMTLDSRDLANVQKDDPMVWGLLGGLVFLSITGTLV